MENSKKRFIGVDFVSTVQNEDRFIRALGGYDVVNQTFQDSTSRLAVNLHPDENFIRGPYLTPASTNAFVMKVKIRKKKGKTPEVISSRVEGIVDKVYQCKGLVGFQYLPARRVDKPAHIPDFCAAENEIKANYEDMSESVLFNGVPREGVDWMLKPKHDFSYVLPTIFSRVDVPMHYYLRPVAPKVKKDLGGGLIAGHRDRPRHLTQHVNFTEPVPTTMLPTANERFKYFHQHARKVYDRLTELFKERPIWNRAALQFKLYESFGGEGVENQLKFVLPTLSYLSITAPWKAMHIRFGYDPKQHPESKHYQTIEFRLKPRWHNDRMMQLVGCKRSPWLRVTPGSKIFSGRPVLGSARQSDRDSKAKLWKRAYLYEPGELPSQLMSYYQLCDINIPEVQALAHRNDGQETECLATSGWLTADVITTVRRILTFHCETTIYGEKEATIRNEERIKRQLAPERQPATNDGEQSVAEPTIDDKDDQNDDQEAEELTGIMNVDSSEEDDEELAESSAYAGLDDENNTDTGAYDENSAELDSDDENIATAGELLSAISDTQNFSPHITKPKYES